MGLPTNHGLIGGQVNHTHHNHCFHTNMRYCAHCDAAYCGSCNKQWGGYASYTVTGVNPWPTVFGNTTAVGGTGTTPRTLVSQTTSHNHSE